MLNFEKYKDAIKKELDATPHKMIALEKFVSVKTKIDFMKIQTNDVVKWLLEEYKEPVLDEAEKEYLSSVIKPFRSRVTGIALCGCPGGRIIRIFVKRFDKRKYIERVELPCFKTGTMYKGMEDYKSYSLEELGL